MRRPPGCVDHESVNVLFVINDPPYGTERAYDGLRLANELAKREGNEVRVFLMARTPSAVPGAGRRHPTATTTSSGCSEPRCATAPRWPCAGRAWTRGA